MFKKFIIITLLLLLVGCSKEENLNPTHSIDPIVDEEIGEEVMDINLSDDEFNQILIDYSNSRECDMDVAFRIYVIETYRDVLAQNPKIVLEQLENHEAIYDKDGNEIIVGLVGPYKEKMIDGICRLSAED